MAMMMRRGAQWRNKARWIWSEPPQQDAFTLPRRRQQFLLTITGLIAFIIFIVALRAVGF